MKNAKERREHRRFAADGGVYAALRPKTKILGQNIDIFGQVLNVSPGGLVVSYVGHPKGLAESYQLDLLLSGHGLYLAQIPFRTVWDAQAEPQAGLSTRRRGIRFERLTLYQHSQLESLIRNHTQGRNPLGPIATLAEGLDESELLAVRERRTA